MHETNDATTPPDPAFERLRELHEVAAIANDAPILMGSSIDEEWARSVEDGEAKDAVESIAGHLAYVRDQAEALANAVRRAKTT